MNPTSAYQNYNKHSQEIHYHANNLIEIVKKTGDPLEGNCFTNHLTTDWNDALLTKRINLLEIASKGKKILELGFNAGHSALLLLLGCDPDAEITFLDIGIHPYVKPCFDYINSISRVKKQLVIGNSLVYLPKIVLKDGQREIYDIIHMDGGHTPDCVVNDMILLYMLLKPGGYMIIDDTEGFILEETSSFISLGLFEVVQGQYKTQHYPHIIVRKV